LWHHLFGHDGSLQAWKELAASPDGQKNERIKGATSSSQIMSVVHTEHILWYENISTVSPQHQGHHTKRTCWALRGCD
jgi:hypothetical protein